MATAMDSVKNEVGIKCLHCGQDQLPPNRITLDSWNCSYCSSGFISIVMLTNLVPRETIEQIQNRKRNPAHGRGCPRCRLQMERVEIEREQRLVELEVCRHCHLIWFNSGDLMRFLRYKGPEEFIGEDGQAAHEAPQRKSAPKEDRGRAREAPGTVPRATIAIFLTCGVLAPLCARFPEILLRYGFLPDHPFRHYGMTWLTSLLLNDRSQMHWLLALLIVGIYVERRNGTLRLLELFFVSGVVGRLVYLLGGRAPDECLIGSSCAVAGVLAYGLATAPYTEFLFPKERWRSPVTAVLWWVVGLSTLLVLYLGWSFFHAAFHQVSSGAQLGDFPSLLMGQLTESLATRGSRALFAGASMGFLWLAVEPAKKT